MGIKLLMISIAMQCIYFNKHSCAMNWDCMHMMSIVVQSIGIALLMMSIVVQSIGIALLMICIDEHYNGNKLLMRCN